MIDHQLFDHKSASSPPPLESAAKFGLAPEEIWETVIGTPDRLPEDVRSRYLDELSGALARRLLDKERADDVALRGVAYYWAPWGTRDRGRLEESL